jgi:hypothetical protein
MGVVRPPPPRPAPTTAAVAAMKLIAQALEHQTSAPPRKRCNVSYSDALIFAVRAHSERQAGTAVNSVGQAVPATIDHP